MSGIFNIIKIKTPIRILDIGAMSLGEGSDAYSNLIKEEIVELIGFEPNLSECEKLNSQAANSSIKTKYFPYAIGDGSRKLFHITNTGMTSSIYEPDMNLMSRFNNLAELCIVVNVEPVETKRLDDIKELGDIDYIKIDIQGAEKEAFENASRVLENVLVVQTEVEFVELYKGQPLFADVDITLRQNGFQFHRFIGYAGRAFKPLVTDNNINKPISQILWSDAVYVKDFMNLDIIESDRLLKMVIILHEIYASYDLCNYILQEYDKREGSVLSGEYLKLLNIA